MKSQRKKYLFLLSLIAILFPTILFADADKIFRENHKAVVVIIAYDDKGNLIAQGSGFIVRSDGALLQTIML